LGGRREALKLKIANCRLQIERRRNGKKQRERENNKEDAGLAVPLAA
jgi:hypothetical protein